MKNLAAALMLLAFPAMAQVKQSGNVTPRHVTTWTTNGVVQDGGTAQNSPVTDLGTTSSNQQSICAANAAFGRPRSVICLGATETGLYLTTQNTGGGAVLPLHFRLNGADYTFPFPSAPINVPFLAATSFGVVADGVTSDDAAVKSAMAACSGAGTTLWFPPGKILLNGSAGTIPVSNCSFRGSDIAAGSTSTQSLGTTFYLTSTSVPPFTCGSNVTMKGVNFYHPNQTGAVVYPPIITDDGTNGCLKWVIDNVVIVDAYDGIKQTSVAGWGDWKFTNFEGFAAHDLFSLSTTGDGFLFSNVRILPGAWLQMGGATTAVGTAASTQKVFHITPGSTVSINTSNMVVVGARYGFYVDSGAQSSESQINATWDAVGTIVDTSAGGNWPAGNQVTGLAAQCAIPSTTWGNPNTGNAPCFNMGTTGALNLTDFTSAGSQGSFVVTAGASVSLRNVSNGIIGSVTDGGDYSQILVTGVLHPVLTVLGSSFGGNVSATNNQRDHVHGITATASAPSSIVVENNSFLNHTDEINSILGTSGITIVETNWSQGTRGAASVILTGSGPVQFANNNFTKPPVSTIASGFGAAPFITSGKQYTTFSVNVGTGGTASSGQITIPFGQVNGYICSATEQTSADSFVTVATITTGNTVTLTNFSRTTGLLIAWPSGAQVNVQCAPY